MHRFFVPADILSGLTVALPFEQSRQIARVLRLREGDSVLLLDDRGWQYRVELVTVAAAGVQGRVLAREPAPPEPRPHITLYQGTLKADKFEWVLQKGTEVGISAFAPVACARSVARVRGDTLVRRERWQRILREAAEQSGRGRIPRLLPAVPFDGAWDDSTRALSLLPWEGEKRLGLRRALVERLVADKGGAYPPVNLFIGPEGGFTSEEVETARRHGAVTVSLGRRILRAETAGVVAAAAVLYHVGELGG